MLHDLHPEGWGFRLRAVELGDAEFIVRLRSAGPRTLWVNAIPDDVDAERDWLRAALARPGDRTFIIERAVSSDGRDRREGMVAIYGEDPTSRRAEWGRWVIATGSLAAPASALLIYETAFTAIGLHELTCRTVAENRAVVGFHDRCGLERTRVLPGAWERDGTRHDLVEHRATREGWPAIRARLLPIATMADRMLRR